MISIKIYKKERGLGSTQEDAFLELSELFFLYKCDINVRYKCETYVIYVCQKIYVL